jgi:hypothetical protein
MFYSLNTGAGAIYSGDGCYLLIDDSEFNSNIAVSGFGGGLRTGDNSTTIIQNSSFSGNTVLSNTSSGFGGAIANGNMSILELYDCQLVNNSAAIAGAVHSPDSYSVIISNCFVAGNTATSTVVGGILARTLVVVDTAFVGNTAQTTGGAIGYISSNFGNFTIQNSSFIDNRAISNDGGCIFMRTPDGRYSNTLTVADSSFVNNTAGGNYDHYTYYKLLLLVLLLDIYPYIFLHVVYQYFRAVLSCSTFVQYFRAVLSYLQTPIHTCTCVNTGSGGALYCSDDTTVVLTGTTMSNNSAVLSGGGLFFTGERDVTTGYKYPLTMNTSICADNSARSGGCISTSLDSMANISSVIISGNTALNGGGLSIQGILGFANSTLNSNSAANSGK